VQLTDDDAFGSVDDVSTSEIREVDDRVRNDVTDTNWFLITFEEGNNKKKKWAFVGKDSSGIEEFKSNIGAEFLDFGYFRVTSGDEFSKRAKFVFIKSLTKGLKMTLRAQLSVTCGDVEKVIKQVNVAVEAETLDELSEVDILDRASKTGGDRSN
jgi:hypothetical protein